VIVNAQRPTHKPLRRERGRLKARGSRRLPIQPHLHLLSSAPKSASRVTTTHAWSKAIAAIHKSFLGIGCPLSRTACLTSPYRRAVAAVQRCKSYGRDWKNSITFLKGTLGTAGERMGFSRPWRAWRRGPRPELAPRATTRGASPHGPAGRGDSKPRWLPALNAPAAGWGRMIFAQEVAFRQTRRREGRWPPNGWSSAAPGRTARRVAAAPKDKTGHVLSA
jgi:hypothetical protein